MVVSPVDGSVFLASFTSLYYELHSLLADLERLHESYADHLGELESAMKSLSQIVR